MTPRPRIFATRRARLTPVVLAFAWVVSACPGVAVHAAGERAAAASQATATPSLAPTAKRGSIGLALFADKAAGADTVVSLGAPFPPGTLFDDRAIAVLDASGREIAAHSRALARWPADGSIRSVLVAFKASLSAGARANFQLQYGAAPAVPSLGAQVPNPDGPIVATLTADWYSASEVSGRLLPVAANKRFAKFDSTLEATLWNINYASYANNCSSTSKHRTYYDGPHAMYQLFLRTGEPRHYRRAREEALWYRANELRWHEGRAMAVQNCQPASWTPAVALDWSVLRRMLAQGMLDDHLISGDPAAREAVLALGEAYRRNLPALTAGRTPVVEVTERNMGWTLMGLASYYALDNSARVKDALLAVAERAFAWQGRSASGAFEHDVVRPDPSECSNGPRGASPFMTSLLVDGLMDYHKLTGDARVTDAVRKVAQWYETQAVTTDRKAFRYLWNCLDNDYDDSDVAELNLLIGHVFGAAFYLTGETKWLVFGDSMANAGLNAIYTKRPKQWNQASRSFGRYLGYRALGATP